MSEFLIVQPWGRDEGRDATVVSEHPTIAEAFAALDALAEQMRRTGWKGEPVRMVVVDAERRVVQRPTLN